MHELKEFPPQNEENGEHHSSNWTVLLPQCLPVDERRKYNRREGHDFEQVNTYSDFLHSRKKMGQRGVACE